MNQNSPQPSHKLSRFTNKIVLTIMVLVVLTYLFFISLPLLAVFLRIDPSQVGAQLQNTAIIEAIQLSLFTSAISTLISIALTVPTAYFMVTRRFPGKSILDTLIDLPIVLPPAVAGVALLLAFAPRGILGPIFESVGLQVPGTTLAVILAQIFVSSPFILRSAKAGFEGINQDVINSARILCDSRLRVFFTVTLPLAGSVIISGVMMTWARAMGEFGATIMFAGNIPGVTQTMPLAIYVLMSSDPLAGVMLSTVLIAISFSILILIKVLEKKRFGAKK